MNDDRPMYDATCANCGNATKVPFQPSGERPVYCLDCFKKKRSAPREREMHEAECATCGAKTTVPFKPTEGRPVYCREHYTRA